MSVKAILLWLCTACAATAQGFAGLGTEAEGYLAPNPAYRFDFPADHGAHPGFRIEWWYLTANLTGDDGQEYGVQWTLFRSALAPDDQPAPIWMGHAAVTTPKAHHVAERFARGGTGQAGATAAPFSAWIDDWHITGMEDGMIAARGDDFAFSLKARAQGPLVAHGDQGYSVKAETGQASYYYSQPFFAVEGVLELPGGPIEVTGQAWLDREWSSQPLSGDQSGWDWVSLHLDSGQKLMGFQLRSRTGRPYTTGTWIEPDGRATPIPPYKFAMEPLAITQVQGREVPTTWRVQLPERNLDVEIAALNSQSWMGLTVPYWEGPVRITGSHPGRGYLEMTGYE